MKRRNRFSLLLAGIYASIMLLTPLWAQAGGHDTDDDWHLTGELYLWGASIGGTTRPGGDVNVGLALRGGPTCGRDQAGLAELLPGFLGNMWGKGREQAQQAPPPPREGRRQGNIFGQIVLSRAL